MTDAPQEQFGRLALALGQRLPLQICKSAAGFYLGTTDADGAPFSRESVEYWPRREQADRALTAGRWTQKPGP